MQHKCLLLMFIWPLLAYSQVTSDAPSGNSRPPDDHQCSAKHLDRCLINVANDQAHIWTSPLHLHGRDAVWLLPLSAALAVSISYDSDAMQQLGRNASRESFGRNVSKVSSPFVDFGIAGATYIIGAASHRDRVREAGLLGAEAVVDASIVTEGLKLASNRDRPTVGDGGGRWWPHGTRDYNLNSSFPSGHAAATWAFARVVSMEFPDRPFMKLLAYGSALTVSTARVMARDHFPSDVLVGSTIGFLTGGYVMRHRASAYSDNSFSYSFTPVFQQSSRTYGMGLQITPPEEFDVCRMLAVRPVRILRRLDRTCSESSSDLSQH